MLADKVIQEIARKVQSILQEIKDPELPRDGEIKFLLHIDGAEDWSWANIRNNEDANILEDVPREFRKNRQFKG